MLVISMVCSMDVREAQLSIAGVLRRSSQGMSSLA